MEILNAMSLMSYDGRLVLNHNDKRANMILAWFIMMKEKENIDIYSYHKIIASGLWCNIQYTSYKLESDLMVISDEDYITDGVNYFVIDIESEIKQEKDKVEALVRAIDENMKNAYGEVQGFGDEYLESVSYLPNMYYRGCNLTNADYESINVNIVGSLRYTTEQGRISENKMTIHFFGDSRFYGLYVEDRHTIPSMVHDETGYRCINYGVHGTSIFDIRGQIENSSAKPGDIVVINNGFVKSEKIYSSKTINRVVIDEILNLHKLCSDKKLTFILCILPDCGDKRILTEQEKRYCLYQELQKVEESNSKYESLDANWENIIPYLMVRGICCCNLISKVEYYFDNEIFVDYIHFSPMGNRIIAKEISRYIEAISDNCGRENHIELDELKGEYNKIVNERRGDFHSKFFDNEKFDKFLHGLREISAKESADSAVIVMNANPFTLGHLYILEEASKQFPHVYVLAVQESQTAIPFEDRIELIKKGTKNLKNISIIPSSEFVVSTVTLPEYFNKEKDQLVTVDASRDIQLFVDYVMPALNVSVRIAGEEPYCRVTREYNRQISEVFERKGKRFVQIKRKQVNDSYISASKVRRALVDGDFELIKSIVPVTTYEYLCDNVDMLVARIREMEVKNDSAFDK